MRAPFSRQQKAPLLLPLLLLLLVGLCASPFAAAFAVSSSVSGLSPSGPRSRSLLRLRPVSSAAAAAAAGERGSSSLAAAASSVQNLLGASAAAAAEGGGSSSSGVSAAALQRVAAAVNGHDLFVFMKGTPSDPQCGFSRLVACGIESIPYLDVLSDPEAREAAKVFSRWQTFPQVYVHREFVGGADIVLQMLKDGSLLSLLQQHGLV
ncbi:hypothetical protein Efla_005568 [Eimeria flavescens]